MDDVQAATRQQLGFATRAVRGGEVPGPTPQPLSVPIYQTSAFAFDDADVYARALEAPGHGYVYSRYENPTTAALEATMADLEEGARSVVTASGMGAVSAVLFGLVGAGDHVVAPRALYGGTYALLRGLGARLGVRATFVDVGDPAAVKEAIEPTTRLVYAETLANPTLQVADIPALADLAHAAGAALVVDNTVASPYGCRPLRHGADVVVHSATKCLAGHSDVVAGVAVFADPARHARTWQVLLEAGACADPFAAWLVLRGIKTLALRLERQSATALALAKLLGADPRVTRVHYPGLPGHRTRAVAERLLDCAGGLLSFELEGGRGSGRRFVEAVRVARLAPSLGGVETLVSHPPSTTHRQLDAAALAAAGIGPGMVRVSVGLEDPADLAADFRQALAAGEPG